MFAGVVDGKSGVLHVQARPDRYSKLTLDHILQLRSQHMQRNFEINLMLFVRLTLQSSWHPENR